MTIKKKKKIGLVHPKIGKYTPVEYQRWEEPQAPAPQRAPYSRSPPRAQSPFSPQEQQRKTPSSKSPGVPSGFKMSPANKRILGSYREQKSAEGNAFSQLLKNLSGRKDKAPAPISSPPPRLQKAVRPSSHGLALMPFASLLKLKDPEEFDHQIRLHLYNYPELEGDTVAQTLDNLFRKEYSIEGNPNRVKLKAMNKHYPEKIRELALSYGMDQKEPDALTWLSDHYAAASVTYASSKTLPFKAVETAARKAGIDTTQKNWKTEYSHMLLMQEYPMGSRVPLEVLNRLNRSERERLIEAIKDHSGVEIPVEFGTSEHQIKALNDYYADTPSLAENVLNLADNILNKSPFVEPANITQQRFEDGMNQAQGGGDY